MTEREQPQRNKQERQEEHVAARGDEDDHGDGDAYPERTQQG